MCRSSVSINNIVHLKYPEDAPPLHVEHAKFLALHASATEAAERAMENAEHITVQLLEVVQSTTAQGKHIDTLRQTQIRLENIIEKLERSDPISKSDADSGVQVSSPPSPPSPGLSLPASPTSSLIVGIEEELP